jgi:uncharacterized repeat protein (TIGR01451 family)
MKKRRTLLMSIALLIPSLLLVVSPALAALINIKLNDQLAVAGQVEVMEFSPDSSHIVYLADHTVEGMLDLYSVPASGGNPIRLYSALDGIYGVPVEFQIHPFSDRVVFRAEHPDYYFTHNLYSVPITGGTPVQLNDDLTSVAHDIYDFQISPDGAYIVYRSDADTVNQDELWSMPITGGTPVQLNGLLVSDGDVQDEYRISADSSRVVYQADQETDALNELYSVPIGGGTAVKLNGALASNGVRDDFDISPDSNHVLYRDSPDLYSVPVGGGTPLKLNQPLSYVGVFSFVIAPDGSRVVYRADLDSSTEYDLFSVPLTGGTPVRLTSSRDQVEVDFEVSPDSSTVVFRADLDVRRLVELYSVPITGGSPAKLNGALTSGGEVYSFHISPDSSRVVYQADQETTDVLELFSVPIGGGTAVKLNGPLATSRDVQDDYLISADSGYAVYRADQNAYEVFELFSAPLEGGEAVRLNDTLLPAGIVSAFVTSPDGGQTAYVGDQISGGDRSLHIVPTAGGTTRRLSDSQVIVGDVVSMAISPDGNHVVYRADQEREDVIELFSAPIGGGGATKLNDSLVVDGDVLEYQIGSHSSRVIYRADQETDSVDELYSVPIGGGTVVKLNDSLVSGGDVQSGFQVSPDGQKVIYRADQDTNDVVELYSVPVTGGTSTKLNGPLAGGDIYTFLISPDSSYVVFLVDYAHLFSVPIGGGTPALLYTDSTFDFIPQYEISPDSSRVVFRPQNSGSHPREHHVFSIPIGGGTPVQLDDPASAEMFINHFQISPDSSQVVYCGDQETQGIDELFIVPIGGGTPLKLNGPLVAGGDVKSFLISPDGTAAVYRADQSVNGRHEMYIVPLTGAGTTRISHPLNPGDDIEEIYAITPDGQYVFYIYNQVAGDYQDLYLFASSVADETTYPLGYLWAPNNTSFPPVPEQFKLGPAGHKLVYAGVESETEPVLALYSVPLAGGANPQRLDGPMTDGGEVDTVTFQISPDDQTVVYRADQDIDEVFELYATRSLPVADVRIYKAADPSSLAPGETLTYSLTFLNAGDLAATGVVISDTIPAELDSIAIASDGAALIQIGTNPHRWQVEDLAPGAGGVLTITGVINPGLSPGLWITNTAAISTTAVEEDTGNNESQVMTWVGIPVKIYLPLVVRGFSP